MTSELYKNHLVISTAKYDQESECWMPTVNISWRGEGMFNFHTLNGPTNFCKTEPEAISQGFVLAKLWVDKRL
jgi:hypothetical protein